MFANPPMESCGGVSGQLSLDLVDRSAHSIRSRENLAEGHRDSHQVR